MSQAQSLFDYLFPKAIREQAGLSDAEASAIYQIWKNSPVGASAFGLPAGVDGKVVQALKTKGYVCGYGDQMEFTPKARKVIVEMVTHEPNAFSKHAGETPYSAIKSKKAGRSRRSRVRKEGSLQEREDHVFNLRKHSIRRMSGE